MIIGTRRIGPISRETMLWIGTGTFAVLLGGYLALSYPAERDAAEAEALARSSLDHTRVCERLGHPDGTELYSKCLTELMQLKQRHEQAFSAESSGFLP